MSELNNIALKILNNGKGILAADESTATMTNRLESVKVQSTAENRLLFRETLFSATGMTKYIGGVILYDETIKQESSKKDKIPELISKMGSVPGIKVDTGAKTLAGSVDEKITEGLDGRRYPPTAPFLAQAGQSRRPKPSQKAEMEGDTHRPQPAALHT